MLYVLTGDVQTGKTRWLQETIAELEARGTSPYGVIAPGRWVEHGDGDTTRFEKTGIDNELLPQHELVPFARRARDVGDDEAQRTCSQARSAQLGWAINDGALNRVNEHLAWVACVTETPLANGADAGEGIPGGDGAPPGEGSFRDNGKRPRKGILIIDELGKLELLHGSGLTNAIALVERGATPVLPHALIIVREQLLEQAKARFADAPWDGLRLIFPTQEARDELLDMISRA